MHLKFPNFSCYPFEQRRKIKRIEKQRLYAFHRTVSPNANVLVVRGMFGYIRNRDVRGPTWPPK